MTDEIQELLARNKAWAARVEQEDSGFFQRLASVQNPQYLWIGCSDSRVPANQITGLLPGEVFVHRNIANIVMQTDLNCMSVLEFAIKVIKIRHIIVCGHYGCAGVKAAMSNATEGVLDHWLSGLRILWSEHEKELGALDEDVALKNLCELNVRQQVRSLSRTTVVNGAWQRGQELDIHGWIYGLEDGLIRDLGYRVASLEDSERL
ncbi:MAG: carbonate dehydratase [Gammaproteobacteria bacterium]|jgi:carbonic anhydrase|nr:carbonate dehydratase [Gammaproteobacteria bacterium]MBT4494141.1 carbonate dehydratase [Gammaproteobacteria bacterium]MBT7372186.1 carbonate dehydratase [Gammaproteobacteria bacterium]